jgi:putative ABC transport system permease protein
MRRVAIAVYRLAARALLPRAFRAEYGKEMEQTVAARLAGARSSVGAWMGCFAELADLATTAAREWATVLTTAKEATMGGGWGEIATSVRSLAKRPSLSLGVALTIGLGIGATTTIYGVVDGVILRPLPYEDPEQLVAVGALARSGPPDPETGLQPLTEMMSPMYLRFRDRARSFTQLAGLDPFNLIVADGAGGEIELPGVRVSPEMFDLLGVSPVLGRAFTADEYGIDTDGAAMISYEHWQSEYGGDPGVLGRTIEPSEPTGPRPAIIGILPAGFQPPEAFSQSGERPRVYLPLPTVDPGPGRVILFPVNAVGRLRPGTTLEQAREGAETVYREIEPELANLPTPPGGARAGIGVNDLHVQTVGPTGRSLWIFLGAAGLLLLLTAMNAATLFLSRALDRTQELGVRVALGAGRAGVVRLLLAEAGALSLVGGALGIAFAYGGVATFLRFAPTSIPRLSTVAVDGRVLAVAALMTLGTALAAGLLPALRLTAKAPWQRLQSGGRGASESASKLRTALVGGQLALAVVLLSGAGLLFSSFMRLRSMDPGFESDGLVVVATGTRGPQRIRITDPASMSRTMVEPWDLVREALGRVPGVTAAAMANALPFQAPTWAPRLLLPDDAPEVVREGIAGYVISPGYLEALGTEVLEGRGLDGSDGYDAEPVALVNEAFVRTQLDGRDALGTMVTRNREGPGSQGRQVSMRIVGVVEDVVQARVEDGARPAIYLPYGQADFPQLGSFWSVVRSGTAPESLAPELRSALASTNRTPRTVETFETRMSATRATPRFQTFLIGAFAGVAMLLAAAGLQGSLAHSVRRRQRELGVRMALGADRASVLRMVLVQGLRVSVVGLAIGIAGTLALSRVLAAFLYDMEPYDPVTLAGVAAVLITVSMVASLAPARRATSVDPVRVLQAD